MTIQLDNIIFDLCGNDFLAPYLRRQICPDLEEKEKDADLPLPAPTCGVRIKSDGCANPDPQLDSVCADGALPLLTLYCPCIVGTGMQGLPRRIAAGIYRGSYFNIKDNVTHVSLIHATDLAAAVALAAGTDGTFTVTDGSDTTIDDLAEALAYRLGDKRIYTIKPWMAKLWYGRSYFTELITDHVASDSFGLDFPDFRPTPVTQYLRTHVYDEKSL